MHLASARKNGHGHWSTRPVDGSRWMTLTEKDLSRDKNTTQPLVDCVYN